MMKNTTFLVGQTLKDSKPSMRKTSTFWLALFAFLLFNFSAFAQVTVSGKVSTDEDPEGLPGVNVSVKGTNAGTTTDVNGNYKLQVADANAVLVFSFVGFLNQEIAVGAQTTINVKLVSDIKALEEIVVIGYGTQKKKDLSGSVTKVGESELNSGPFTNPLQRLTGRAAGVNINQVGSEPGTNPTIRIRGITSLIGGNDPLVVVDGIQGNLDLLNQIPPNEIESIDILKDASATAIYGSRGAAGVVMVTTKKGKEGKTSIEYSGVGSVEMISKQYELLSAAEWRAEAAKRGIASSTDFGGNTDWQKEVTRNGFTQNHNVAFGGGTAGFNYRATLTAIGQEGIIINSGMTNYIARLQASQKALNNKLTLSYNLNLGVQERKFNNADVIGAALGRRPTDPIYRADGGYFIDNNTFGYVNPYARAKEMIDGDKTNNLFGSLRADYEIVEGLTASLFGSWRKTDRAYNQYRSPLTTQEDARSQKGIATRESHLGDERLLDLILNYRKSVGDHSFEGTFVYEWQQSIYEGFRARGRGFETDLGTYNLLQAANTTNLQKNVFIDGFSGDLVDDSDIRSYKNDQTLISFLGRFNYSFKGKYLFMATFRRDGSSKFGANNKWASFPSLSFAWRVVDEDFFKSQNILSDLKVRLGYGVTGNQQGLTPQRALRLVTSSGNAFFGGGLVPSFGISQNENKDLKWETREMFNVGIDFGFLTNRLTGTFDYYTGITKDLLFNYAVPQPPYPYGVIRANVGSMRNTGMELSLNYLLIDKEDLKVTLGGNITRNTNEILELSGSLNGLGLNLDIARLSGGGTSGVGSTNNAIQYFMKGQPVGVFYLFKHAGVDDQGNQIIDDLNGNGVEDQGDLSADRYIAGNALPEFSYAFNPSVSYKNWDLTMVLRGVYGNDIYNTRRATLSALSQIGQSNVINTAPADGIRNITYATDYWLEKGSFARLENLTVAYRFKTEGLKVIDALRLSFTANNLFIITNYSGIDPEVSANGERNDGRGFGTDSGIYPRTRSFALGLNVSFK